MGVETVEACQAVLGQRSLGRQYEQSVAAVNEGRADYSGAAAERCFEAIEAESCVEFYDFFQPEACREVFLGLQDDGAACVEDSECSGGVCDTSDGCPGVCAARVAEGGACRADWQCDEGLSCYETCVPISGSLGLGQECGGERGFCVYGLFCGFDPEQSILTCQELLEAGAPCEHLERCEYSLFCIGGECGAETVLNTAGGDCDPDAGRVCGVDSGLVCVMTLDEDYETCEPAAQSGEPCVDADAGRLTPCDPLEPLYCDEAGSGTCLEQKGDGEYCVDRGECLSDHCDEGLCRGTRTSC